MLGPGLYGELRKEIAEKKPGDSKAPFTHTKARFEDVANPNPGPGAYNAEDLVENVAKKP